MKHYAKFAFVLIITLANMKGFTQNNTASKPRQFQSFPSTINCSEAQLAAVFNKADGQNIDLQFSDNFIFAGTVESNLAKYRNLQTVIIRSAQDDNTIFSISRVTEANNNIYYTGRIINRKYFDGFELKKETTGDYKLAKTETDVVIQECRQ